MKTIMQELVDIMNEDQVSFTEWFQDNYQMLIEKEKEQIMKAYCDGFDELLPFHENDYYNQTYNNETIN